jgi:hypothetical protein
MRKPQTNLGSTRYRVLADADRPAPPPGIPVHPATPAQYRILNDVLGERARQDDKWGVQTHPNGTSDDVLAKARADDARADCQAAAATGHVTWALIAKEEFAEALAEADPAKLREELIQNLAVLLNWVENLDRDVAGTPA